MVTLGDDPPRAHPLLRLVLALGSVLLATAIQWVGWRSVFHPFTWFLLYPAVFLGSWLGGRSAGLLCTAVATAFGWFLFLPPEGVFIKEPRSLLSVPVFMGMGILFSFSLDRLRRGLAKERRARQQVQKFIEATGAVTEAIVDLPKNGLQDVLATIAEQAQALTGSEYAAAGIGTDPEKPFEPWASVGISVEEATAIGRTPRPIGLLGVVAKGDQALRLRDPHRHPEYRGVPPHHPEMTSFLGVPIRYDGRSVGNLYLANKLGGDEFTAGDQQIVEMLAGRVGTAIAVAHLYQAEAEERTWLQLVVDQLPDGIVLMDAKGRVTTQNQAFLALSGDSDERDPFGNPMVLDLCESSGRRLPVADLPSVRALLHGEVVSRDLLVRTRDGRLIPVSVRAAPVHSGGGKVAGMTMVVQDIAVQRELDRLREQFCGMVAHDLRNPIQTILLQTNLLRRFAEEEKVNLPVTMIERIERSAQRLHQMTHDLLDVTRIELLRLHIAPEVLSVASLTRTLVERIRATLGQHPVELQIEEDMPAVRLDPLRFEQILTNLLDNAAKYSVEGTTIRVEVAAAESGVELAIVDRGRGIPVEEIPKLFDRFYQGQRARERKTGLGLGLFITRSLVDAHGGRIEVESEVGKGSKFRIWFPAAAESQVHEAPQPHA